MQRDAHQHLIADVIEASGVAYAAPVELNAALAETDEAFLKPRERQLVKVPDEFDSVHYYCSLIAHNMLAEFWHGYCREGPRGPPVCLLCINNKSLFQYSFLLGL